MGYGRRRYARKTDASQKPVVEMLSALGCSVFALPSIDDSLPDLLVGVGGKLTFVVEVKNHADPTLGIEEGRFTTAQDEFWRHWNGNPLIVLHDRDEALQWVMSIREV